MRTWREVRKFASPKFRLIPGFHQKLRDQRWRLQNMWILPIFFKQMSSSILSCIFSNFWHFYNLFWLFLTCKYNKQKTRCFIG